MNKFAVTVSVFVALAGQSSATKPVPNRAYVKSGPDGVSYARCIPEADAGSAGTTRVYSVGRDKDTLIDTYDWYAPRGVTLGWSPVAGKVAVMALGGRTPARSARVELSFHLGGKLLAAYTAEDLRALGVEVEKRADSGHVDMEAVGCEQVAGTNDCVFVVETRGHRRLAFDIVTGKVRKD
jgi:hypothetical protein